MGLLDQVVGGLLANSGSGSPMGDVLGGLLRGAGTGQAGTGAIGSGGIGGLVSAFEQAGLGHVVQSWIGSGPNQPVSPQQLQSVFGSDQVQSMAGQAGMSVESFLGQLCQHLPRAVDGMTPNGQLPPPEGTVSV